MKLETLNDEMLRRYLLEDVSDEERQAIEERFMQDNSFFEEMLALEDELHYEYRQDRLKPREKNVFERKFLQSQQDRKKSIFAQSFLQATAELVDEKKSVSSEFVDDSSVSWWQSIVALFSFSRSTMKYGLATAGVLLAFGLGFLFFQNAQLRREMASLENNRAEEQVGHEQVIAEKQRQQTELQRQLDDEKLQGEQNEKRIGEMETERERLEQEIAEARRRINQPLQNPILQSPKNPVSQPQRSFVALVLSPGLITRGNGQTMNRVKLSPAIKSLQIRLLSKNEEDYQIYRATLKTLDEGNEIWKSPDLKALGKGAKKSFSLNIPANILQRADYELSLIGVTANGNTEEITTYYFSVLK